MTTRKEEFICEGNKFHLSGEKLFRIHSLSKGSFCTITRKGEVDEEEANFLHKFNLANFLIYREVVLVRFPSFSPLPTSN
jgi:hypothetical protein